MNCKKVVLSISLLLILLNLISLSSADVITPGFKTISITNKITNMNNFNDYYLISNCDMSMGETKIIQADGIIPAYYKFCNVKIFALSKTVFNNSGLTIQNNVLIALSDDYITLSQ